MVNEVMWRGKTVYECELCGSAYEDLATAERCEQYCYSHGKPSPRITKQAVREPQMRLDPVTS